METNNLEPQNMISENLTKENWNKPELYLISVKQETLGPSGGSLDNFTGLS